MGSLPENVRQLLPGLQLHDGKRIPFYLLYDHRGSEIYQKITEMDTYYLFHAEKLLLHSHARAVAQQVASDSVIVELGCGTGDKTGILLDAIKHVHHRCHFVGIDVSRSALDQAENTIGTSQGVQLEFIQADYMDGLKLVRKRYPEKLLCVLWLGSSLGNLSPSECKTFLHKVTELLGTRSQLFLCVDMWKDEARLRAAYRDHSGITESFIKNGMRHGLQLLGHAVSDENMESWIYDMEINHKSRQVEMYVRFPNGLSVREHGVYIREDERVLVEISRKFTDDDILQLSSQAGLVCHARWKSKDYGCYMLLSCEEAILRCWEDTDKIFAGIKDWLSQPVSYRHPFIFYYGHVAAFTRLKLLKDNIGSSFNGMFSRGIDPLMLDPSKCHSHPETPPEWPSKEVVKKYATEARAEVLEYLRARSVDMRRFSLILEHERMHQETLAYLLVQQRKIFFEAANSTSKHSTEFNGRTPELRVSVIKKPDVRIPRGTVPLGCQPIPGVFRWDNEEPAYTIDIEHDFSVSSNPVSIAEFMCFVSECGYDNEELWEPDDFRFLKTTGHRLPATWSCLHGEYYVHYPERTVRWTEVAHSPVYVSLMEAGAFCKWLGWRLMTEAEYHRVLNMEDSGKVKQLRGGGWEWTSSLLSPFPGFVPMEEYPEYSHDFFDSLHYVLKGSSPMTHVSLVRDSFRNFYQRQYPYVFAKFRACK